MGHNLGYTEQMKAMSWKLVSDKVFIHSQLIHSIILSLRLTVMKPSSRPESGLGGACSRSMDHFSMMEATWLFSVLRILKPVMFTPLYR